MNNQYQHLPLVAIGGVGGSGTRLVAEFMKLLGYHIGDDLNHANDNLWFTLLFKRLEILSASDQEIAGLLDIFLTGMTRPGEFTARQAQCVRSLCTTDRLQHSAEWLEMRANSLLKQPPHLKPVERLAWKEPNTHIVIQHLQQQLPNLKYIHVMRNGLDMAYSANQNQLKLWGEAYLGRKCSEATPYNSLQYWVKVHLGVLESVNENVLLLNFDELCQEPDRGVRLILDFLGVDASHSLVERLCSCVVTPGSTGRFKQFSLDVFDEKDLQAVKRLGF